MLARTEGNVHLHILNELAKDRDYPIEREAAKLGIADSSEFRVRNTRQFLDVAC
jgi:hypothetical protein